MATTTKKPDMSTRARLKIRRILAENLRAKMRARYPQKTTEHARMVALSEDSGVSLATMKRILGAQCSVTVDRLQDLSMGLRCEADELLRTDFSD